MWIRRHAQLFYLLFTLYIMPDTMAFLLQTNSETLQKVFSYKNLVHAVSGAAGSVTALTVFFPLDTARTRLQVDDHRKAKSSAFVIKDIIEEEGISAIYRGLFPVVSSLCVSNFVYFYTYNCLKAVFITDQETEDAKKDLVMALVAGVVNVLVTTPLWVVNTRLKLQGAKLKTEQYKKMKFPHYNGILDALLKILRFEGVSSLWSGTLPSLVLTSNPSIQFMTYEVLKRYFQRLFKTKELSGVLYFVIGAIAKTVATVVTYPVQVVQMRARAGYSQTENKPKGVIETLAEVIRTHGFKGLYKGLEAKLLQTVLTAALMFLFYEEIVALTFRLMKEEAPKSKLR